MDKRSKVVRKRRVLEAIANALQNAWYHKEELDKLLKEEMEETANKPKEKE